MKKLNTIFSFVLLSFCLLINVSYADFGSSPLRYTSINTGGSGYGSTQIGEYTSSQIYSICNNYFNNQDNSDYKSSFDTFINSLKLNGLRFIAYTKEPVSVYGNYYFILESNVSVGVAHYDSGSNYLEFTAFDTSVTDFNDVYMITGSDFGRTFVAPTTQCVETIYGDLVYSTTTIKSLYVVSSAFSADIYWDGTSYYYEAPTTPDEPETPTMPTNAEIAQAVQAFYDSDYYKNNKDFGDFFVLYTPQTGYFSFIGHNYSQYFTQTIVSANYPYNGESYDQDWWMFEFAALTDDWSAWLLRKTYWLYSTNDFGQTFENNGTGYITDLLDLRFSTNTMIVYSTADYKVQRLELTEDGTENITSDIIPGDIYTYDENLEPSESLYDPFSTFVPSNPTLNILGDVNFDEINKTFEENKGILNIENASWLFTANNKLIGYFIGFLSLLIVFLIISRALGG